MNELSLVAGAPEPRHYPLTHATVEAHHDSIEAAHLRRSKPQPENVCFHGDIKVPLGEQSLWPEYTMKVTAAQE